MSLKRRKIMFLPMCDLCACREKKIVPQVRHREHREKRGKRQKMSVFLSAPLLRNNKIQLLKKSIER